jgi:hypothetical protein
MRKLTTLAFLTLMGAGMSHAGSIQFTTTGQFDLTTPATTLTAPGAFFTFMFLVSTNPVVGAPTIAGSSFSTIVPSSLVFNSTSVNLASTTIDFFPGSDGGFEATLVNGVDKLFLSIDGPQLYSGTTSNPTILPTSYTAAGGFVAYTIIHSGNSTTHGFVSAPNVTAGLVPEPATIALVAGALVLGLLQHRKRVAR